MTTDEPIMEKQPDRARIIFLHHSTGRNLIWQGGVRELIAGRNDRDGTRYELWDHDYNSIGLKGPAGENMGVSFDIPNDNTNPDGLAKLFSQPVHDPPDNALSHLLMFDAVILKSCFSASAIHSQAQLDQYKRHYLLIGEAFARYPQILFMIMTPPPLVPRQLMHKILRSPLEATGQVEAKRAREFSLWLTSGEFLAGLPNVTTFDFFDMLAEPADSRLWPDTLRARYRSGRLGLDSHPNRNANRHIAPLFVDWIWESFKAHRRHALGNAVAVSSLTRKTRSRARAVS